MLAHKRIAMIGAGNMAEAMIRGLLSAGAVTSASLIATGPRQQRLDELQSMYHIETSRHNVRAVAQADIVVLCVKPQIFAQVLQEIAPALNEKAVVISIAAGVPIAVIESYLREGTRVVRAMPNTPARVLTGATAISAGRTATELDMQCVQAIFEAIGFVTQVEESQLDAVTGLSGSGPAYVFLIIDALADAGVKVGLPRYKALKLSAQTVLGSAKLLLDTGEHPGVLKDAVTSPGGTAIAGLHTLEEGGLRTTLINAVVAATNRSRELGLAQ